MHASTSRNSVSTVLNPRIPKVSQNSNRKPRITGTSGITIVSDNTTIQQRVDDREAKFNRQREALAKRKKRMDAREAEFKRRSKAEKLKKSKTNPLKSVNKEFKDFIDRPTTPESTSTSLDTDDGIVTRHRPSSRRRLCTDSD